MVVNYTGNFVKSPRKKVDMSHKRFNPSAVEMDEITILGNPGEIERVPIDIDSIPGQRPTDKATIKEHFIKEGKALGYDEPIFSYSLWSPPQVARFIDRNGRTKLVLFDGDHRRHMWALAHPKDKDMLAYVVDVGNLKEAQALFPKYNKTRRKPISAEALFICDVKMEDPDALEEEKLLRKYGVRVAAEPTIYDSAHSVPAGSSKPHVPINAFRRAVTLCTEKDGTFKEKPLEYACGLLATVMPSVHEYSSEAFQCLVALGVYYPKYLESKRLQEPLEDYLGSVLANCKVAKKFNDWKLAGGNVHGMAAQSMVKGLIADVRGLNSTPRSFERAMKCRIIDEVLKARS